MTLSERCERANKDKVRHGKTEKDRKRGCQTRNTANVGERGAWSTNGKGSSDFPYHTLGGKGNSARPFKMVTGRGRSQKYRSK